MNTIFAEGHTKDPTVSHCGTVKQVCRAVWGILLFSLKIYDENILIDTVCHLGVVFFKKQPPKGSISVFQ